MEGENEGSNGNTWDALRRVDEGQEISKTKAGILRDHQQHRGSGARREEPKNIPRGVEVAFLVVLRGVVDREVASHAIAEPADLAVFVVL